MPDNPQLNLQWCERHWAPYRGEGDGKDTVRPNGIYASMALMQTMINDTEFLQRTKEKRSRYGMTQAEAGNAVMEEMFRRRPLCCQLGDSFMDLLLKEATEL